MDVLARRWTLQGSGVYVDTTLTALGDTSVASGPRLKPDERIVVVPAADLRGAVGERDHYKAALERIVFTHADAPEVPAHDLADMAGDALDSPPTGGQ